MLYGLYISAAGLKVNEYQQAVHSNNLANVGTVGFKLDRVVVESRPPACRSACPARAAASGRVGR